MCQVTTIIGQIRCLVVSALCDSILAYW